MKQLTIMLLVALFAMVFISAQAQEKFGIRAGYQGSALYKEGSRVPDTDPLGSFYVGVFRDNKIVPAFYIGTGIEYMQSGFKVDNDNKLVLHYISIPVYLKAKIGPVFGLGGIGANFKVSEKLYVDGNSSSPASEDKSKMLDFPAFVGLGVKILMFTIEGRYHWGLVDINEGYKNRYFQLGAGISF
jgi:hypothetical protein